MNACRNCSARDTRLPLGYCRDCWRMLIKGFLGGVGAAIAGHVVSMFTGGHL